MRRLPHHPLHILLCFSFLSFWTSWFPSCCNLLPSFSVLDRVSSLTDLELLGVLGRELMTDCVSASSRLSSKRWTAGKPVPASRTFFGETASLVPQISSSCTNSGKPLISSLPSPVVLDWSLTFLYFLFRLLILSRQCFALFSLRNSSISLLSSFTRSALRHFPFLLLLSSISRYDTMICKVK